jgi:signal transduction histidine kinase
VTQALSATLDLERVLELILSELQQAVPYDCASVQRLEGDVLQIVGGRGFPDLEELLGVRFDVTAGDNPNRQVIHTRAPVVLDDAPASYSGFNCEPHVRAGVRSWLGVPLLFGDRLIGMIALDKREPGFYTQQHARMAQAFAAQAAIAMENARLFAQEEQRAAALSQALEQQRELDRLKDQFIQNVSHELRTPLALIQGYIDLLQSGELGELQPRQREPVSIIARRTRLLNKLVENLMAILETVTQNSERESVDLAELVERLRADFEHTASQAGLTLTTQIVSNLPPIFGDPAHLYQVLDNLLANAVKFTSAGGHITVRVWREDAHVVIEVADTGVGIPKAELDRVFERFYQVDGSMSRRYGGAGLGLALVKEIVEAHGGSVSVQSHVGQGTSVRVSLPASAE